MSFISAFVSFHISLNNPDQGISELLRLKIPRHEEEDPVHFVARIIAYCHSYRPEIKLLHTAGRIDEAVFSQEDLQGNTLLLGYVAPVTTDELKKAGRSKLIQNVAVYLFQQEHLDEFLHSLRGSKTNWIEQFTMYFIDSSFLLQLSNEEQTKNRWELTILDGTTLYLQTEQGYFETSIASLNPWQLYQQSIQNN